MTTPLRDDLTRHVCDFWLVAARMQDRPVGFSLAAIYEGGKRHEAAKKRHEAAKIGGVTLQIVRRN